MRTCRFCIAVSRIQHLHLHVRLHIHPVSRSVLSLHNIAAAAILTGLCFHYALSNQKSPKTMIMTLVEATKAMGSHHDPGGRFGSLFDDDPKQWRMYADIIGSAGSIFELSTQLYPAYFLPLASLGNLAKAIARGLKDPSFRVIQNHFAMSANLGEVAAKINLKRARILVKSHVVLHTVPGFADCNKEENILSWERFVLPRVFFGVSLDRMIGREGSSHMVKALLRLYMKEKYILFVNQCGSRGLEFLITFKVGATGLSVLKSLWQVYWLHEQQERLPDHVFSWLKESLLNLEDGFADFLKQLEEAGWDKHQINLNVPNGLLFEEIGCIELSCDK
ncbi:putative Vitamin B6 photo-protection and homoeostasis [Cocos nucifera]|uniref:Putative Vitamin B6 photo-protection and homoeostasis n=1 Tax=Cocos nucifera TaxID=13894 RepID=A0A8K0NB10_COCNU|nr:putative Vitamin B6 photo-protection and homoeostasis [Cocos nucifera]